MVQAKKRKYMLLFLDIIFINLSYLFSYMLRFDGQLPFSYLQFHLELIFIIMLIKLPIFYFFKLYNSIWKYASIDELLKVIGAAVVGNTLVLIYLFLVQLDLPRSMYVLPILLDIFLLGGSRFTYRALRRMKCLFFSSDCTEKRVLIVGAGEAGAMLIQELQHHKELKIKPIALIDCDPSKQGRSIHGVTILGKKKDIIRVVEEKDIDEIIIAIPSAEPKVIKEIIAECQQTKCKLKILPGIFELAGGRVTVNQIKDVEIEDLLGREAVNLDLKAIAGYLQGKVVLVTGGGGSIGSELCRQIAKYEPANLLILDIYENSVYDLQQELKYKYPQLKMFTLIASVRDKARLDKIFAQFKPEIVFHAAAHKHVPLMEANPTEAIKNNVFGTLNLAECSSKHKVEKFVLISTDKAVNPTNIMGASKRACEMIIQAINKVSATDFVAVRFGNVLGSNGSVIPLFKRQIAHGGPITVTHPEIIRYFMTIPEAVQLVMQAGSMAKGGEIFVLDMGEPVKIVDLARDLIKLSGFEPDIDIKIEFSGLRPGEKLYEELLLAEEGLNNTEHQKICIAKPLDIDFPSLRIEIEKLKTLLLHDSDKVKEFMEVFIPTYKSEKK